MIIVAHMVFWGLGISNLAELNVAAWNAARRKRRGLIKIARAMGHRIPQNQVS